MRRLQQKHPESLVLIVRHFPLRGSPGATMAAVAAQCAAEQGHFESIHHLLFRPPLGRSGEAWSDHAETAGLADHDAFAACIESTNPDRMLEEDLQDAGRLGVSVVPTLLVNDRAYQGLPWDFERIVEHEISQSKNLVSSRGARE